MISLDDYLVFVDDALDTMVHIVESLGDDLANRRADIEGANSPYAILTHCLGVMEYWGGHLVSGRPDHRDRESEFRSVGSVGDLVARTAKARRQLHLDVAGAEPLAPLRTAPGPEDANLPLGRSQGGALFHIYEELAQHLGQIEGCRDVLTTPWVRLA
ncbi:MAG: DinB family protein [Actinomycetota bacterium]|nr:DinB family protein [Actinomycetota bacterium]